MTERSGPDIALEILLAQRLEVAPDLPEELIRACYFVQKNNQFTSDRSLPMAEMERLIDSEVEKLSAESEVFK
ncbi:hypothetical protein ACFO5X_12895 [Seohaeicola nanhaiensis]|uniref:Uncharacterized protein n=1 Tax=Seohaeicola nanhaiensis TaxID=1387282 RepID=A0ABV9KHC9_9RHOB|nr:hypothetical protein [Paracoccus aminovorans]